mgnify:CR=1 FL=1
MKIKPIMESGGVMRFHTMTGTKPQSVAEHSWGVAIIIRHFKPDASADLLMAALTHDCAELVTGDVPSTAKWVNSKLKEALDEIETKVEKEWGIDFKLSSEDNILLKVCDSLEGMSYCVKRANQGELEAKLVFYRWAEHLVKIIQLSSEQSAYLHSLEQQIGSASYEKCK